MSSLLVEGTTKAKREMTHYHEDGTQYQHACTLAFAVKEITEEGSEYGCTYREPAKDVGSLSLSDAEVALKHVGGITLEREDG